MPQTNKNHQQMTIRVGRGTLSFLTQDTDGDADFHPYVVKSGVSMAANLREAFKTSDFLTQLPSRATVMVDGDVLLVPINLFDESQAGEMFVHAFPGREHEFVFSDVIASLRVVAVSSINKDLRTVIEDHFQDVTFKVAVAPVWRHLQRRAFSGKGQKLFGYIHEHRLDLFSFQQNRFNFFNSFDIRHTYDACYFLLYVWNQLHLQATKDELLLVGDLFQSDTPTNMEEREQLLTQLHKFLQKICVIDPSEEFGSVPATQVKGMPYDMQTLLALR